MWLVQNTKKKIAYCTIFIKFTFSVGIMHRRRRSKMFAKKRPEGLQGKQIGLFYRDMARVKSAEEAAKIAEEYADKAKENEKNDLGFTKRQKKLLRQKQMPKTNLVSTK